MSRTKTKMTREEKIQEAKEEEDLAQIEAYAAIKAKKKNSRFSSLLIQYRKKRYSFAKDR